MAASSPPAPYTRLKNFVGQSPYKDATLGASMDDEFNAVQVAVNAILARLTLIQRDDGGIANGTVGKDQIGLGLTTQVISSLTALGINATNSAPNILTVGGPASLFTSAGASGTNTDCRLSISKGAAANTASLVLQDSYSTRAEIGLTGDDSLHFKVSADGSAFVESITITTAGIASVATPPALDSSTRLATTAFVAVSFAPKLNPTFTGLATFDTLTVATGAKTATAVAGAATLNKASGVITSEALVTGAGGSYTLTLTNSTIAAADLVFASVVYGTATTGRPAIETIAPKAGSVVFLVRNTNVALNGTIVISFFSLKI